MRSGYVLKTFAIFCCCFLLVYTGFIATHLWQSGKENPEINKVNYTSQTNNMIIPNYKSSASHFTRVEIAIKDDLASPNGKISKVKFNNDVLHLQPSNAHGNRGSTFLQLKPGVYTIRWKVKNSKYAPSKHTKYSELLKIHEEDLWKYIQIEGNRIKIN
jgi:hypothetical protein